MLSSPKRSALLSGLLHAAAIALVLLVTGVRNPPMALSRITSPDRDIARFIMLVPLRSRGGGGGGMRQMLPASKGTLPRAALRQFTPPMVTPVHHSPILPMEPTIIGAVPFVSAAQYGDPNGILGLLSGGPGRNGGIGDGDGGGVGRRKGPGAGDDYGVGISGTTRIRGAVTQPVLLEQIEPEYSEEARKARLQGTVVLRIEVNERGVAQNITVRQSLGLGLDERAVEAVRSWRFRPGTIDGKPGMIPALVEVNFRLL